MRNITLGILFSFLVTTSFAAPLVTHRTNTFDNEQASAWETTIYPGTKQSLPMHHHDHNRVIVALTDGVLKVTNDKGQSHLLKVQKNHAYYLEMDKPTEKHIDTNLTNHPIKFIVIELKNKNEVC